MTSAKKLTGVVSTAIAASLVLVVPIPVKPPEHYLLGILKMVEIHTVMDTIEVIKMVKTAQ